MVWSQFLFYDLLIVTLLVLADWLIGEENRQKMRNAVADWWVLVASISFYGFGKREAAVILRFLHRVVGKPASIFHITIITLALSFILSATIIFSIWYAHPFLGVSDFEEISDALFLSLRIWGDILIASPINVLFTWISFIITLIFLQKMVESVSLYALVKFALLDTILGIFAAITSFAGTWALVRVFPGFLDYPIDDVGDIPAVLIFVPVILLANLLPSLLHLIAALTFLLSRLFRPLVQLPSALVLERFAESKKGVLSLVAIAVGTAAKLIDTWFKMNAS